MVADVLFTLDAHSGRSGGKQGGRVVEGGETRTGRRGDREEEMGRRTRRGEGGMYA